MKPKRIAIPPELAGELIEAATRLHGIGCNLLPVGIDRNTGEHKKPLAKLWKPFTIKPMPLPDLIEALRKPGVTGIGLITGPTSGNVIIRDFDDPEAYREWARRYPHLAKTLPTESTGKPGCYHVFFRADARLTVEKLGDGELRGAGAFTVISPSLHTSGVRYRWVNPLGRIGDVPMVDPEIFDLRDNLHRDTDTQRRRDTEAQQPRNPEAQETQVTQETKAIACVVLGTMTIDEAIAKTCPTGPNQRNRGVFELARILKGKFPNAKASDHQATVRRWHTEALPAIDHKEWDLTWAQFIYAFDRVHTPHGQGIIANACAEAFTPASLATVPTEYESEAMRKLYPLCRAMGQRAGQFHLACRKAGELIGIDHNAANALIRLLVMNGVLTLIEPGTKRRASVYRFNAPSQAQRQAMPAIRPDAPAPATDAA